MLPELSLHVLLALGDGPAHGYAIGKDIAERTQQSAAPTTGSLYQTLKKLTDAGLIRHVRAPAGMDPRRKYFAITPAGKRVVAEEIQRLESIVAVGRRRRLYGGA